MSRLLTLLMIAILVVAHGSSVAAAVCRHQSPVEHVAALGSGDARISQAALGEEAAGKVASKKGQPTDSGSVSWLSGTLPTPDLPAPFRVKEPVELGRARTPILTGASLRPLLEPPAA